MVILKRTALYFALNAAFAIMCVMNFLATNDLKTIQPAWYFLSRHSYGNFGQIAAVSFGYRPLLADVDYISMLQYYGDPAGAQDGHKRMLGCLNAITDAEPDFTFAYTYGAAILAFNLKRYDEAISIIQKGISFNPSFWKLRFYLGAIIYSKKGDTLKLTGLLEEALKFSDHPAVIERMLGNIYEISRTPDETAQYWVMIFRTTKDAETRKYSSERLKSIIASGRLKYPSIILKSL
jgi:tetratricopeptide (TPR) repeat protein